jgi:hypothetical protein
MSGADVGLACSVWSGLLPRTPLSSTNDLRPNAWTTILPSTSTHLMITNIVKTSEAGPQERCGSLLCMRLYAPLYLNPARQGSGQRLRGQPRTLNIRLAEPHHLVPLCPASRLCPLHSTRHTHHQGDRSSPLRIVYPLFGSPSTGSRLPGLRIELSAPATPVFTECMVATLV